MIRGQLVGEPEPHPELNDLAPSAVNLLTVFVATLGRHVKQPCFETFSARRSRESLARRLLRAQKARHEGCRERTAALAFLLFLLRRGARRF